eukprot:1239870-Pleurochrysis_carterae.AAC.1
MRGLAAQWLAVAVPREANGDADRLSHPAQAEAVRAEACAAGLEVVEAAIPAAGWQALRGAIARDART